MKLLHIIASPRGENSRTLNVSNEFLNSLKEKNQNLEIDELDLFKENLPEVLGNAVDVKYTLMSGGALDEPSKTLWDEISRYSKEFLSYDAYLISCPMWNFTIPYKLKHYIDLICQPGESFTLDKQTFDYVGLIKDKPLQLILASSSTYADEFPQPNAGVKQDFQHSYLQHAFQFIGFTNIATIKVAPTTALPQDVEKLMSSKMAEARAAAKDF